MAWWTTPTPGSRRSSWECGIARARTVPGRQCRRPSRSRTSRSRVRCRISPSTRCAGIRTTTPSSDAFGRPRHGRQRTHTMHMSSLVVDKARQLAAAGHHAEVIEYLGAQERSELADSPTLALLYGTAQARLGRNDEGLRWLDLALDEARRRPQPAGGGQGPKPPLWPPGRLRTGEPTSSLPSRSPLPMRPLLVKKMKSQCTSRAWRT